MKLFIRFELKLEREPVIRPLIKALCQLIFAK